MTDLNVAIADIAKQMNMTPEEVAARLNAGASSALTVRQHLDAFLPKLSKNTRRTYRTHLNRFVFGFGPACDQMCEPCMDPQAEFRCRCDCAACRSSALVLSAITDQQVGPAVYNKSALEVVATIARRTAMRRGTYQNRRRAERGQPKKNADGVGAQETAVAALRALFQDVPHLVAGYDGHDVAKPHRSGNGRRPLLDFEILELWHTTGAGGNDPQLDLLIIDFGRETGARRSGAYLLTVGQIRRVAQIIKLKDKYGREEDAPVSLDLIERLLAHAIERGGSVCDPDSPDYRPDSSVFYYQARRGIYKPITARRFDTLHSRWHRELDWAAEEQVGYHHLRHTISHELKTRYGPQYAKRYLRHSKGDVTDTYGACTTAELAWALSDLFNYEHPLVHGVANRRAETLRRLGFGGGEVAQRS